MKNLKIRNKYGKTSAVKNNCGCHDDNDDTFIVYLKKNKKRYNNSFVI